MLYKVHSFVLWNILFIFLKNSQCVPVNFDPSINPYNSMKSFRRHQRSFPSYVPESMPSGLREPLGPVNRNIYRRSMYNDNPSMLPPAYRQPQYDFRHKMPSRDVDEEYTVYPLRTRTVQGFDDEDQDLIHEEMGDDFAYIDQKSPTRYQPDELYKKSLRAQYVPERRKPIRPDVPTYHMKMAPPMKQQQQPFNPATTPFGPIRPPQENYNFVDYGNDNMYEPITQHPQNFQSAYQYVSPNYNPPQNSYLVSNYESRFVEPEGMFTAETAAYYPRYGMKPRFTANNNGGDFMSQMDMMMNEENMFDDDMQENSEGIIMPADSDQIMMDSSDEEDDVMLKVPSKENDDDISGDYLEMENIQESGNDKIENKPASPMDKEKLAFKPDNKKNDEATSVVETGNGDEETDESHLEDDDYEENI